MKCVVTAGPTYEPLDQVRRLTNFSTGRLGSELAEFLGRRGHSVLLLKGALSTYSLPPGSDIPTRPFTTTLDLKKQIASLANEGFDAVFHAAAVSDFKFGVILARTETGSLEPITGGKLTSRGGALLAELIPTEKIIASLRSWFPHAFLAAWKYETDGSRDQVLQRAKHQIEENKTDCSVANGPAYGPGFGLVTRTSECHHLPDTAALFSRLAAFIEQSPGR